MRIELTRAILIPWLSNFLKNSTINFRVILYLVTCFLRVSISLLCRLQAVSKIHIPIYPNGIIVKEDEIVRPCDRHSNETVTFRKHVTKYKNMRKWMVECRRKFESHGIYIARVNKLDSHNQINHFTLF